MARGGNDGTGGEVLLRRDEGGVAWLTLNRPAARNALSTELMSALEAIDGDAGVRIVTIGGGGAGVLRRA